VLDIVTDWFGSGEGRPRDTGITEGMGNEGWAKEVEEIYQSRREEELQKTEKDFDKERRKGHVEIHWPYKRRDNGTTMNTILRFDVCEDEGTG